VRFAAACWVVLGFNRGVTIKILRVFRDGWETR
jgi:hypothetical protein